MSIENPLEDRMVSIDVRLRAIEEDLRSMKKWRQGTEVGLILALMVIIGMLSR